MSLERDNCHFRLENSAPSVAKLTGMSAPATMRRQYGATQIEMKITLVVMSNQSLKCNSNQGGIEGEMKVLRR